jgi:hypothetical protein
MTRPDTYNTFQVFGPIDVNQIDDAPAKYKVPRLINMLSYGDAGYINGWLDQQIENGTYEHGSYAVILDETTMWFWTPNGILE